MGQAQGQLARSARCIALVGPYLSGKTTLLEAILARTGAIGRQGTMAGDNTVGDASEEARHHGMSVELNAATVDFLGDSFTFLDCPGSIEFQADAANALTACDAAVVVCEPDEKKVPALQLILKQLEDRGIPHFLFVNKIDKAEARVRDIVPMLQPASGKPLVLRQLPIWENDIVTGFIDLALERAYVYREHAPSEVMAIPDTLEPLEKEARFSMLEKLADYDDALMEQLLEDVPPPRDRVFDDLGKELRDGLICPVLLGSAETSHGIFRLLKALRHEAPFVQSTAKRIGVDKTLSCALVVKTFHTAHGGKLSLARVLTGNFADGTTVYGGAEEERISGVFSVMGQEPVKRGEAKAGDTVAFGRLDSVKTGDTLGDDKAHVKKIETPATAKPVFGLAIAAKEKKDEVKLTAAITKIIEEDPSISLTHSQEMGEMVLWGQGEMHLRVALEKLVRKYGIDASTRSRQIPYKETIRKSVEVRGRHKKQSGGHGQFGDVVIYHQAATARRRVRVLRRDHRRRGAQELHPERRNRRARLSWPWTPRLSRGRRRGLPDRRVLSQRQLLRYGVPPGGPPRHERGHAAMLAGAARAGDGGRDRRAVRRHRQDQLDRVGKARPDPRLRRAPGLVRMGPGRGASAGIGDPEPDRRAKVGDCRRRHLQCQVRPPRRADRQSGRSGLGDQGS